MSDATIVIARTTQCPHCEREHVDLVYHKFKTPIGGFTHYSSCPEEHAPLLMVLAPEGSVAQLDFSQLCGSDSEHLHALYGWNDGEVGFSLQLSWPAAATGESVKNSVLRKGCSQALQDLAVYLRDNGYTGMRISHEGVRPEFSHLPSRTSADVKLIDLRDGYDRPAELGDNIEKFRATDRPVTGGTLVLCLYQGSEVIAGLWDMEYGDEEKVDEDGSDLYVYVQPARRRKGMAKQLIEYFLDTLEGWNGRVQLNLQASDIFLYPLFRRNGFMTSHRDANSAVLCRRFPAPLEDMQEEVRRWLAMDTQLAGSSTREMRDILKFDMDRLGVAGTEPYIYGRVLLMLLALAVKSDASVQYAVNKRMKEQRAEVNTKKNPQFNSWNDL